MGVLARAPQLTAATLFLATAAAFAFEPPTQPLAERVASADAVVQAVVDHVEYRMSRAGADEPPIPYTFVTFTVERVLHRQVDGGPLTLRFLGGLFTDGPFLDNPIAPLFDTGERSILLVSPTALSTSRSSVDVSADCESSTVASTTTSASRSIVFPNQNRRSASPESVFMVGIRVQLRPE